jgi:hypothetical protein
MSGRPNLFLSYAEADRKIGERLHASLERLGCTVHDPARAARTADFGTRVEQAVRGSDHFVLLFGRHRDSDRLQEQEWQVALEESWEHPDKGMIPVLLRDAELPSFVRSAAAATGRTVGLHVHGLREVEEAAEVIARTVRAAEAEEAEEPTVLSGGRFRSGARGANPPSDAPETPDRGDEEPPMRGYSLGVEPDREQRKGGRDLSFVVEPATPEESSDRFSDIERYADELELSGR